MPSDTVDDILRPVEEALADKIRKLLEHLPEDIRTQAAAILADYGPKLFELGTAQVWKYVQRAHAGDLSVMLDLQKTLSSDAFLAIMRENEARWQAVAHGAVAIQKTQDEIAARLLPILVTILLALLGV